MFCCVYKILFEIGREKEAGAARLADERTRSERHLQDSLSESVRAQTQLKMELSEMALHMTVFSVFLSLLAN
jgi:hypothetical protein